MVRGVYDSINQGAFAVILFAGVVTLGVSRSLSRFLKSDFSQAIVVTIRQINENQEHVEALVQSSKLQKTLTETIRDTMVRLQSVTDAGADLDVQRHAELMAALTALQKSLRDPNS